MEHTDHDIGQELLPIIKVFAVLAYDANNEGEPVPGGTRHWHGGECITSEEGWPALLLVFRTEGPRDHLESVLREQVQSFVGRLMNTPEQVQ